MDLHVILEVVLGGHLLGTDLTAVDGNFGTVEATVAGQQLFADEALLAALVGTLEWLVAGVRCN